jgi:hypothetical protein
VFRNWAKRVVKNNLIYLDETAVRVSDCEKSTLVLPGESQYVVVDDNSSYAARYDMIAVVTANEVLPPIIFSPDDRKQLGVSGINSRMLLDYIEDILARSVSALDRYPMFLVLDNATIHNREKMLDSFRSQGCEEIADIKFIPPKSAKRLSPLDNGIFGIWKNNVRKNKIITKNNIKSIMITEWEKINSKLLHSCYKHCCLTCRDYTYKDCPQPNLHNHTT